MTDNGLMPAQDEPEDMLNLLLENIPSGLFRYEADDTGKIDFVSQDLIGMLGCANREEFNELTGGVFEGIVHPDDRRETIKSIDEQIEHGSDDAVIYRLNHKEDKLVWVDDRGRHVVDADGKPWFYVTLIDITEKVKSQAELERASERIEILTELSNDILFDIECETGNADVYGDFEGRFGRKPEHRDFVVNKRCKRDCNLTITQHDIDTLRQHMRDGGLVDFETSTPGPDGEAIWYRYQSVVLYDEDGQAFRHVGRLLDTHEMMIRETMFKHKAERDGLTGIYNRETAVEMIDTKLLTGVVPYTFILIDVDDFKSINDTYGHPEGDFVLKSLALFLTNVMRKEDIVARLGGDEFAVFAPGLGSDEALERILSHIARGPFATQRSVDEPLKNSVDRPEPTVSIGAITTDSSDFSFDEIYSMADDALYESKGHGKAGYTLRHI